MCRSQTRLEERKQFFLHFSWDVQSMEPPGYGGLGTVWSSCPLLRYKTGGAARRLVSTGTASAQMHYAKRKRRRRQRRRRKRRNVLRNRRRRDVKMSAGSRDESAPTFDVQWSKYGGMRTHRAFPDFIFSVSIVPHLWPNSSQEN